MKNKNIALKIIYLLSFISFLGMAFLMLSNKILPLNMRMVFIICIAVFYGIIGAIVFFVKKNRISSLLLSTLLILAGIFFVIVSLYINKSVSTVKGISESQKENTIQMSLIVPTESTIQNLSDIGDLHIEAAFERDFENVDEFRKELKAQKNLDFKLKEGKDYVSMANNLLSGNSQIMLLNESFRTIIEEQIPEFSDKTRVVEPITITHQVEEVKKNTETEATEGFNLYISGIDTYGNLINVSRSDVNIIATVNPKSKKILLTTVPRDSYVRIPGRGNDQYDKLTHAGLYGVNTSRETLENLLDIDIDYYARVNFSSLVRMVDALGGIDVYNPQAFTPRHGKHRFDKGYIHLNGEEALAFSRERYSLADGDFDRGKNQMRVIEAMISKALSPSILINYPSVLDVVLESTETNMPHDSIIELVNQEIANSGGWNIESESLDGEGSMGLPSYAMPGYKLFMFQPYESSINQISQNINNILKKSE